MPLNLLKFCGFRTSSVLTNSGFKENFRSILDQIFEISKISKWSKIALEQLLAEIFLQKYVIRLEIFKFHSNSNAKILFKIDGILEFPKIIEIKLTSNASKQYCTRRESCHPNQGPWQFHRESQTEPKEEGFLKI